MGHLDQSVQDIILIFGYIKKKGTNISTPKLILMFYDCGPLNTQSIIYSATPYTVQYCTSHYSHQGILRTALIGYQIIKLRTTFDLWSKPWKIN